MNRIKQLRKQKGVTVKDLAEKLGIAQSMLTNYENGGSTPRNSVFWENLAAFFGVSIGYLMGVTNAFEGTLFDDDERTRLPFLVFKKESICEKLNKPMEIKIETPEMYLLLANIAQLPDEEIVLLLQNVQKTIREKYAGRLTELRMADENNR